MKPNASCAKCGSSELMRDLMIVDAFSTGPNAKQPLHVEVHTHPGAWLFKGTHKAELRATICADCGFTELYVSDPQGLREAFRKQQQT